MRFKSFVSMGVAAALIVPTLITAANPELAYAKTTSKTSKKISAKAKSVIAKIKAINPKKSNYVTKTKSAVNAYKKLSSKDKKMVYNYGTLKKHWTIVQNRKAKQVIAKIKAINPKKSDYVLKTKSALSAYKKLSKTDKKKVKNYSTLQKHWKKIQPYLKKVDAFNKSVATLNKTNFPIKSITLEKQYNNLDPITKSAIPSETLEKLNHYGDVVKVNTLMLNTFSATDSNGTSIDSPINNNNSNQNSGTSTATTPEDGTKILAVINAYKKLSGAQQTLLKDLLTANSSANSPEEQKEEDKKEKARKNLDRYLAVEDLVKKAADIEKKYLALQPVKKAKPKDLVALYDGYNDVQNESIVYKEKDASGKEIEPGTEIIVSNFVPHSSNIKNIGVAYENEINNAKEFKNLIDKLENETDPDPYNTIQVINKPTSVYKIPSISIKDNPLRYPLVAPIDLADKNAVTTYKKYESVPDLVNKFEILNLPPLSQVTWAGAGVTSPTTLTPEKTSKLVELLPQYNKLGANQKSIVLKKLTSDSDNAKDYLSEGENLTSAQAIDKSYASAIKNKAKSSYFADLKKVYDAYSTTTPEVKRFVVNADKINGIPSDKEYTEAKDKVDAFTTAVNNILSAKDVATAYIEIVGGKKDDTTTVDGVIPQYKTIASKPAWLGLVDKNTLKTYGEYAKVPDVLKLKLPTSTPYKSKDITNILNAIKEYKKLGKPQKEIVDSKNSAFSSFADDESYIKEAQKIDNAYLKLKKSSKTYTKDAKAVYQSYDDASDDVKKYLVYLVNDKISKLHEAFSTSQGTAETFEKHVNELSNKSTINDVETVVKEYNNLIAPKSSVSNLVDKNVMKKYNEYAQVSNVDKLLNLIIGVDTNSDYITPTNVYYIQKATIAYNALKPDPKMIIDAADRKKFPFLYETKNILDAVAIDKAYEKIKPTDDKYELDLIDLYREMYVSAPFAQKYVTHKDEFDRIESLYKEPIAKAEEFETSVDEMSHVSLSNGTPTMEMVRNLEAKYYDLVNYNKFGTKYKFPLKDMIKPATLADYNKFVLVLRIQDIAKTLYVSYGKLFNEENVDFDYVKDSFYCKKAEVSSDQNIKNEYNDNCKRRDEYLADSTEAKTKYKVGYTVSNSRYGQPMKISNPNDIKLIYKAIDYFQQLDSTQVSILKKAPSSQKDYYYEDRYKGKHKDGKYEEKEIVHPSIPMSDGEIKNFLKAQEIDKEYEALNPSSKTYIQDAIVLYYKFNKAGKPVQLYVVHENDIKALKNSYNMDDIIGGVDDFVKAVNLLSNGSSIDDIKNGKSGNQGGVVDQYNNLSSAQLAVIDKGVLTKYNAYAPIAEIKELTDKIKKDNNRYTESSINNMLKAISIYKKLSKDPKKIINVKNDAYKYLTQEADIKAAQKVDNAFKKLDKTDEKYVTNLKKVYKDFEALSDTAEKYITSNINGAVELIIYKTPNDAAKAFENLIQGESDNDKKALINKYPITYLDVENVVKNEKYAYNNLSTKAKSLVDSDVMKIYNKYAPIVEIVETLKGIKDEDIPDDTKIKGWAESEKEKSDLDLIKSSDATGYYKGKKEYSKKDVGSEILNAIQLYNKLGSDQKDIVQNKVQPANPGDTIPSNGLTDKQKGLLNETNNIKAAQALDKKIAAIKPNSTGYVKGVIDATKTLNVMPIEQRIYLQNVDTLKGYLVDSKTQKSTQTQKAIEDLTKFEKGVKQVDQWTSEMEKDSNGNITGTCTDNSTSPASTTTCSSNLITKQMNDLKTQFDRLNTPRLIDGSEVKLASLIDRTILARYQYFRAIYDVIDGLEGK